MIIAFSIHSCYAQDGNSYTIRVGPNFKIPAANQMAPMIEPHLAINPVNPAEMIVAVIIVDSPSVDLSKGRYSINTFYSADNGRKWKQESFPDFAGADPNVIITPTGFAFVTYLGEPVNKNGKHLLYRYSHNAGKNWSDTAISLGRGHDREVLVTDRRDKVAPVTYLASAIYTKQKSYIYVAINKEGKKLEEKYRFLPNNLELNTFNPVILTDGSLVVPYIEYSNIYKLKSKRAWVIVSNDSAKTFGEPLFAFDNLAPRNMFAIAADLSNKFASNRLYSVKVATGADSINYVAINISDDKGVRWSSDISVDHSDGKKVNPRVANISVSASGIVGVSWFDSKNHNAPDFIDLYFAASIDGGKTFLPAVKVTEVSANPQTTGNGVTTKRWPVGGDYYGLESFADNKFKIVWTDSRTGVFQLYHSDITIERTN